MKSTVLWSLLFLGFVLQFITLHGQAIDVFTLTKDELRISAPPANLKLDPFYKKYIDANGFPVISRIPTNA